MKTIRALLTVLVENSPGLPNLGYEHGLSFWLETQNGAILWDTGQSDLLIRNAQVLEIPLSSSSHIVLSHGHYDHTGGLSQVLEQASHVRVFGHPDMFRTRYSQNISGGYAVKPVGSPYTQAYVENHCESLNLHAGVTEILPDIFTTGEIPRMTEYEDTGGDFFLDEKCTVPDTLPDDQALYFQTQHGMVVLLGCAHSGVVNTLNYVSHLTGQDKIYAVLGGMHLNRASEKRLEATAETLARFDVQVAGPCHCTGQRAMAFLQSRFPDTYVNCSTGSRFTFS